MKTRLEIINETKRIRRECQQILTDADHWNTNVRKGDEKPIDPDPNGELKRIIAACDACLASEIRISEPKYPTTKCSEGKEEKLCQKKEQQN